MLFLHKNILEKLLLQNVLYFLIIGIQEHG